MQAYVSKGVGVAAKLPQETPLRKQRLQQRRRQHLPSAYTICGSVNDEGVTMVGISCQCALRTGPVQEVVGAEVVGCTVKAGAWPMAGLAR